ncbi:hypothetical protein DWF00_22465 [Bosea caraganae]|uniref:Uncharacterized protein n=1 Tax=Bosea caraganae TaxID=2763117 RepID=A0A370L1F3_9HYPH|nr:hypothetical protein DWE98_20530 [Bosea caraganae]RDJ23393.1 hypothetical protein DWF00_22465 [Bosea caraganae]
MLVHLVGAWIASEAAAGRYPRPVAIGLAMLVSRLGPPTIAATLATLAFKSLRDGGAFDGVLAPRAAPRRRAAAARRSA